MNPLLKNVWSRLRRTSIGFLRGSWSVVRSPKLLGYVLVLALGFFAGWRVGKRSPVEVHHAEKSGSTDQKRQTEVASKETSASDKTGEKTTNVEITKPDGTIIRKQIVTKFRNKYITVKDVKYVDRWHTKTEFKEVEKKVLYEKEAKWGIGPLGGVDIKGDPVYGGIGTMKIAGPVDGFIILSNKVGLVGFQLKFH